MKPKPIGPETAKQARKTEHVYLQTVERINEFLSTRGSTPNSTWWYWIGMMNDDLIDRLLVAYRTAGWRVSMQFSSTHHDYALVFWEP